MSLRIRDRPPLHTVSTWLDAEGLPGSDLTEAHLEHFFLAGSDESPSGLIGLELYGSEALLRSLVVRRSVRGQGVGSLLVQHAECYASACAARSIYLLTTTAEAFLQRLGYERIDRRQAPASIQQTRQFASLCPASSAVMMKPLSTNG